MANANAKTLRIEAFAGRVALVTGAGSGIGLGIARALAGAGTTVVVADRDEVAAKAAADEIGGQPYAVDVTDAGSVEQMAAWVRSTLGRLDVLVNNAGVGLIDEFKFTSLADFTWVFNVNFWGVVHGIKAFLPLMEENTDGAVIVNTTSMAAVLAGPGISAYGASKAAVLSMSDTLRSELAPAGRVGVTVLLPHLVATNIEANAVARPGDGSQRTPSIGPPEGISVLSADEAGALLLDGLRRGASHVFTHPETEPLVAARFEEILSAYQGAPRE